MAARWFALLIAIATTASWQASAQSVSDDLCNFAIEGITLASGRTEVASVFGAKGWHDLSATITQANGVVVDRVVFDRTRVDDSVTSVQNDPDGPLGRFQMILDKGVATGMQLSDDAAPGPVDRAHALCALLDNRFDAPGCQRISSNRTISILARPANFGSGVFCTVSFSAHPERNLPHYTISVSRTSNQGRGRGRLEPR